ncbi:MAG: phage Gp37/Gp68 family protein [Candidatus Marinimicrobia bacterium]|nr:phage Gp37/Gp68 family protein [Candidatus Neomarinimicrobiota bacterium]
MAQKSSIEWTESTWNPTTGCTKVSPGCKHCYAERLSLRLQEMGQPKYANGFELTLHENVLEAPLRWRKPQTIFVNSMSDLFHEHIPLSFLLKVFDVMRRAHWHVFQILTKRSEILLELDLIIDWPSNVWMGVSVENEKYQFRIDHLRKTRAAIKFLSLEPLLGPLPNLDLENIDWAIVGGESGPGARPMEKKWVVEIRDQCFQAGVRFFFKQWGGVNKKKNGRVLEGQTWDDSPVRQAQRSVSSPQLSIYSAS